MGQTKLNNMVNPEVMGNMISGKLPAMIKFTPFAQVDSTLVGQPGDTITIPRYEYIGDAEDVAEGVAMGTTVLTTTTMQSTIKKVGKAVELTDEAVLSGYGDPVGQTADQLAKSIASKIDEDCITAVSETVLVYDGIANKISYDGVVNALDLLSEEEFTIPKVVLVHSKQVTQLRLDPDFKDINKYPLQTVMKGVVGEIAGCQVVISNRIRENNEQTGYENIIMQTGSSGEGLPALSIYLKRDLMIESDRDILAKTTVVSADEHYTTALTNPSKVVKAIFLK